MIPSTSGFSFVIAATVFGHWRANPAPASPPRPALPRPPPPPLAGNGGVGAPRPGAAHRPPADTAVAGIRWVRALAVERVEEVEQVHRCDLHVPTDCRRAGRTRVRRLEVGDATAEGLDRPEPIGVAARA